MCTSQGRRLQQPGDFESTQNNHTTEDEPPIEHGLDLTRLDGFELSRNKKKLRSFIWTRGWRLIDDKAREHWLCRYCHTAPARPRRPQGHLFGTTGQTSGPINHLRNEHSIVQPGSMPAPPRRAVRESSTQLSITGFTSEPRHLQASVALRVPLIMRSSKALYYSCLQPAACPSISLRMRHSDHS